MDFSTLYWHVNCFAFLYKSMILFTNPSTRAGYDTRSIFKRSLTGLNSEFSFSETSCLSKAEEPSLFYYLPIAGGRIIGFIPSPRVLVLCEMQSGPSRIWTRVAVSISYDDNDYTTGTSMLYKSMIVVQHMAYRYHSVSNPCLRRLGSDKRCVFFFFPKK